jgi:MarR family transcriptional regulator, organic hydroperoxide resistance regulator
VGDTKLSSLKSKRKLDSQAESKSDIKSYYQESLENQAWRSIASTYKKGYLYINSDLRKYGLTPPQYTVLRTIWRSSSGLLPMNEIGKEMVVTFANITTIVDNLEKMNYVRRVRDQCDRRIVRVQLLSKGTKLVEKIYSSHQEEIAKLMSSLKKSELESLIDFTDRIKERISSEEEEQDSKKVGESGR